MSEVYEFTFPVEPTAKARPRVTRSGHAFTPKKTRLAETELRWLMRSQFTRFPFETPLRVEIVFSITRPKGCPKSRLVPSVKPDIDNLIKLVTDAGNEILWRDDNLIVEISARKEYGSPSIRLTVSEIA